MQIAFYPRLPQNSSVPPQNYDLTSYQLENSSHIYTTLGIDTLVSYPSAPWNFEYQTTGNLNLSDYYDVLEWGYDNYSSMDNGDESTEWVLLYEGPVNQVGSP